MTRMRARERLHRSLPGSIARDGREGAGAGTVALATGAVRVAVRHLGVGRRIFDRRTWTQQDHPPRRTASREVDQRATADPLQRGDEPAAPGSEAIFGSHRSRAQQGSGTVEPHGRERLKYTAGSGGEQAVKAVENGEGGSKRAWNPATRQGVDDRGVIRDVTGGDLSPERRPAPARKWIPRIGCVEGARNPRGGWTGRRAAFARRIDGRDGCCARDPRW